MRFSDSRVQLAGLDVCMAKVLIEAERIWKEHGRDGLTVTAGLNGCHSPGSVHYYGFAVDLRTRTMTDAEHRAAGIERPDRAWDRPEIHDVAVELQRALGDGYRVAVEATHIHVERLRALIPGYLK